MTNQQLTTIEPQAVAKPQKPAREPRISPTVRRACELLGSGQCKTIKAAAMRVGMSREHLSKMLQRPHVQAFIARKAAANISMGGFRATYKLVDLLDADSEKVAADVATRLAENAGYIRPQQGNSVNVSISNNLMTGYVYDLAPIVDSASTQDEPKDQ